MKVWRSHQAASVARALSSMRGFHRFLVEEGLRDVALWNAATLVSADLTEAIKARLGKAEPSFGPLAD